MDASVDLQKAIVAALKASAPLNALVAGRIYDMPPTGAVKPYVSLGPEDWADADGIGVLAYAGAVQIDAWSAEPGKRIEVKRVANAIQDTLHQAKLVLDSNDLVMLLHRVTRYFIEGDGLTKHAALDFRAFTSPP